MATLRATTTTTGCIEVNIKLVIQLLMKFKESLKKSPFLREKRKVKFDNVMIRFDNLNVAQPLLDDVCEAREILYQEFKAAKKSKKSILSTATEGQISLFGYIHTLTMFLKIRTSEKYLGCRYMFGDHELFLNGDDEQLSANQTTILAALVADIKSCVGSYVDAEPQNTSHSVAHLEPLNTLNRLHSIVKDRHSLNQQQRSNLSNDICTWWRNTSSKTISSLFDGNKNRD
jgi:hypothetical protein